MPINTYWDNDEKTIIRVDIIQKWELDAFYRLHDVTTGMMDTVSHKIIFIAVGSRMGGRPRGISLRQSSKILSSTHPNTHAMIILGMSRGIQLFLNVILRIFAVNSNIVLVQTEEEAYQNAYDLLDELHKNNGDYDETA